MLTNLSIPTTTAYDNQPNLNYKNLSLTTNFKQAVRQEMHCCLQIYLAICVFPFFDRSVKKKEV